MRPDGSITDIKINKSAHQLLDEEAIHVIKSMPKWTPAKDQSTQKSISF
ncbi:MAG: energy transducer TonB [Porphyromonas sp.]|nr:energy transducer TonB [Porphyromonas sp.]